MFNRELHRRLDGEEVREIRLRILDSFYQELLSLLESMGRQEEEGLREVLAAGVRAITGWKRENKPLDQMSPDERMRFLQDRLSSVDAAYSRVKFQAYQVMKQNDALEMNLRGMMPQFEAATQRVGELEEEVRRLRRLVPPDQQRGDVLVLDRVAEPEERVTFGDKLRHLLGGQG